MKEGRLVAKVCRTANSVIATRLHPNALCPLCFQQTKRIGIDVKRSSPIFASRFSSTNEKQARRQWGDAIHTRQFLDSIAEELGIKEWSDWYGVTRKEVLQRGGWGLFYHYTTLLDALKVAYPQHPWDESKVYESRQAPPGYWTDKENLSKALDHAEKQLGIKQPEDWYSVALSQLKEIGFPSSVSKTRLVALLAERYPDYKWEKVYFLRGKFAQQQRLERAVASLFPGHERIINARKEANLINPETGDYLELDIYIPSLQLALEYQEIHHYTTAQYAYDPLEKYKTRDDTKLKLAKEKGITLILIPFWWDGKIESLTATIKYERPDLLSTDTDSSNASAIPKEMPSTALKKHVYTVEDIGQPTTACFLTKSDTNPTGWWVFEKYDGVRGFWNPLKRAFYSRLGNKLNLPEEIVASMPQDTFLDGELWFGRDNFSEASKISARANQVDINWANFKYMVFDIPNNPGIYSQRYELLEKVIASHNNHKYLELAPKEICKDTDHLELLFQNIVDKGGEGVILRDPNCLPQQGRSRGFLKHKKFRDAEAKIIGDADEGLQWKCILPNGVTFSAPAGTTEFVKRWNPKVGDIVSFKYRGFLLGSKKPILPTLYRLRTDLTWEEVVNNWKEKTPTVTALPIKRVTKKVRQKGYWMDVANWRKMFIKFAEESGFDPFVPENWNNIQRAQLPQSGMYRYCDGSLSNALEMAFPELQFSFPSKKKPHNFWRDIKNCRKFFDGIAAQEGFDPLDADNWYTIGLSTLKVRGGTKIRAYYGGFKAALKKAYPEVEFKLWISARRSQEWQDPKQCRKFFDEFAMDRGINPMDPKQWYSDGTFDLLLKKLGGYSIQVANGGFKNALKKAYPEVDFKWNKKKKEALSY